MQQLQRTYFDYALHENHISILAKLRSAWFPVKANQFCGSPQGVERFVKGKSVIHLTSISWIDDNFNFQGSQSKKLLGAHLIHDNVIIALCGIHMIYVIW